MAGVRYGQGHPERAAQLLGASAAIQHSIDPTSALLDPANRLELEHTLTGVRAALGVGFCACLGS